MVSDKWLMVNNGDQPAQTEFAHPPKRR